MKGPHGGLLSLIHYEDVFQLLVGIAYIKRGKVRKWEEKESKLLMKGRVQRGKRRSRNSKERVRDQEGD